jgi:hypothetical protein
VVSPHRHDRHSEDSGLRKAREFLDLASQDELCSADFILEAVALIVKESIHKSLVIVGK